MYIFNKQYYFIRLVLFLCNIHPSKWHDRIRTHDLPCKKTYAHLQSYIFLTFQLIQWYPGFRISRYQSINRHVMITGWLNFWIILFSDFLSGYQIMLSYIQSCFWYLDTRYPDCNDFRTLKIQISNYRILSLCIYLFIFIRLTWNSDSGYPGTTALK